MKGKAAAFMAVLAIAAAFGLGAGIYLEHSASNYAFAGDIVYGERDSAGDFAVSESLVLSEHMRLSTLYSHAGGESCAESGWGPSRVPTPGARHLWSLTSPRPRLQGTLRTCCRTMRCCGAFTRIYRRSMTARMTSWQLSTSRTTLTPTP